MTVKSNEKSNNQKRGGKRPGAGRKPKVVGTFDARAVEAALGQLKSALPGDDTFTGEQRLWHLAMVMFGVPVVTITEALFKPQVSARFRDDIISAIKSVERAAG